MTNFTVETTGDEVVKAFMAEIPGKTVLITGPSDGGIGGQTAIFIAAGKPKEIILAGRNYSKIQPVIDHIKRSDPDVAVRFVQLDLADLSSVRNAAKEINSQIERLDILINNAGIMAVKDYTTTKDGIEMQFGSNHIGHFLLTNLLIHKIFAAGEGARIVNVASGGYKLSGVRYDDWNFKNGAEYNPWLAYGQSKTANVLFASSLAEKLKERGILAFSLEPGVLETKLQSHISREMFSEGMEVAVNAMNGAPLDDMEMKSLAAGAATSLYAALAPSLSADSGKYLHNCAVSAHPLVAHAAGAANQEKLWALSEKLVGEQFTYI